MVQWMEKTLQPLPLNLLSLEGELRILNIGSQEGVQCADVTTHRVSVLTSLTTVIVTSFLKDIAGFF